MRATFAIVLSAIALAGCNQDEDVTGSVAGLCVIPAEYTRTQQ